MSYYTILWHDLGDRMTVVDGDSEESVKKYVNRKNAGKATISKSKSGDIDWYGKNRIAKVRNGVMFHHLED